MRRVVQFAENIRHQLRHSQNSCRTQNHPREELHHISVVAILSVADLTTEHFHYLGGRAETTKANKDKYFKYSEYQKYD